MLPRTRPGIPAAGPVTVAQPAPGVVACLQDPGCSYALNATRPARSRAWLEVSVQGRAVQAAFSRLFPVSSGACPGRPPYSVVCPGSEDPILILRTFFSSIFGNVIVRTPLL